MKLARKEGYGDYLATMAGALALALFTTLALGAIRLIYLALFSAKIDPATGFSSVAAALGRGFLFDMQVGFYFAVPALLVALSSFFGDTGVVSRRTLSVSAALISYLTAFNAVAGYHYVKEYGDLYNEFLFGLVFDDRTAIVQMIWREYHVLPSLAATALLGYLFHRGAKALLALARNHPLPLPRKLGGKLLLGILLFALAAAFGRGGVGPYPIQYRDRDATRDAFLNKLVMNPWSALHFSIQHQIKALGESPFGKEVKPSDVRAAALRLRPGLADSATISDCFASEVAPSERPKARHLFLIVIESYDAWPYLDRYADLRLVEEGKKLAAEGVFLRSFCSTSVGTMTSLAPLITGLYNPGIHPNFMASSAKPYETAPAELFRSAGFRTRLISGGSLSWQRLGDFAGNQGFSERYGMESITKATTVNEWGVDDGSLFNFALEKSSDDAPSFTVILTTGNHPSYKHDIAREGWTDRGIPASLTGVMDGSLPEVIMGHLWYSDLTAARFAREIVKRHPDAVVAITGDHFSRKFLNTRPSLYERSTVPLILYGPKILGAQGARDEIAGNHLDILPTLYQLALPTGTKFRAVGSDLLAPSRTQVGLGANALQGPGYVVNINDPEEVEVMAWAKGKPGDAVETTLKRRRDLQLISWWLLSKGGPDT